MQNTRGTGLRKLKNDKLSRTNEREDYAGVLNRGVAEKDAGEDNVLCMNTVMRGVEMFALTQKNEFDMISHTHSVFRNM